MGGDSYASGVGRTGRLEQLQVAGACDRLGAAGDPQLAENAVGVGLDGADGDHQRLRDLGVRLAVCDQAQHLALPLAEGFREGRAERGWRGRSRGASAALLPRLCGARLPQRRPAAG